MPILTPKVTPEQQGVQYLASAAPTFNTGTLVPTADSWTIKEVSELEKTQDGDADVDNIGTSGHFLAASGSFKIAAGETVPNKGDAIIEDGVSAPVRWWIITSDVEVTGFSSGGKAVMVKMDIEYHVKVSAAIITP